METELCKNMQTYSDSLVKATLMKISPIQYHQFWLAGQYVNQPFQEDDRKYCEACNKYLKMREQSWFWDHSKQFTILCDIKC